MVAGLKAQVPPCPSPTQQPDKHRADALHLWLAPLAPSPTEASGSAALPLCGQAYRWLQQLGQPLPPHLHDRLARFRQAQAQSQRAAGLSLVCTALHSLAGISPAATLAALGHDASGCPRLHFVPSVSAPEHGSWGVSFSYAPGWAACALRRLPPAQAPTQIPVQAAGPLPILGVDVEHGPLKGRAEHFAAFFSPAEQEAIAKAFDSDDERVRRWTCKEAMLKALGIGFSCDPRILTTQSSFSSLLPLVSPHAPFPPRVPLHCTRLAACTRPLGGAHNIFWQCLHLAPYVWLTAASFPAWEKTHISFLRLA